MRSPDFIVKIAADSIEKLRAVDVFRVLDNCSDEERKPMARAIVAAHPDRRYAVEIIGCWSEFADCSHIKDADCVVSPADDSCVICKVHHGDACMVCGGRGFHTEACSLNKANSQTGANILKRAIEHMCSGEWSEDRADALEILNVAIEECFAVESPSAPVPSSFASPGFDWQVSDSPTKGVAVVLSLTAAVAELVADALSAVEPSGDSPDVAEELACAITERLREQANQ